MIDCKTTKDAIGTKFKAIINLAFHMNNIYKFGKSAENVNDFWNDEKLEEMAIKVTENRINEFEYNSFGVKQNNTEKCNKTYISNKIRSFIRDENWNNLLIPLLDKMNLPN